MADSLIIDWLNENMYRAYPLKENILRTSGAYSLPDDVILDAQFIFETVPDPVKLLSISADNTNIVFNVSGALVFSIPRNSIFPISKRLSSGNLLVVGSGTANIPNGTFEFSNVVFEPSVITEFANEWLGVKSIGFDSIPDSEALVGDVNFLEGYQFGISINNPNITFRAGSSYGVPIGCSTFGDEVNDCDEIISFINGVAPSLSSVLKFAAGSGVVVLDDPPNHRIFVGLSFDPADVCKTIIANPND